MTAPDIATLHGWAMHGGLFDDLAARWPGANWHRIDLPGHGTRREHRWPARIEDLLDDITARTPDGGWLLGWSLGGLLAMQALLRDPGRIQGLILIAATPCFVARPHWTHGVDAGLVKAMALELGGDPDAVIERFLALETRGSARARDELKRLKSVALRHGMPDRAALIAGLNHLADTDLAARLGEIDAPVQLIGGRRDRLVPWAAQEATHQRLPDSRLTPIPGSAHAPFITDPQATADAIRGFVLESARV